MLTKEELPDCPVATTVQLIGGKWKLLILRNLLQRPWRFNELKKSLEGISQKDPDRQFALHGSRRNYIAYCFPGSAAARGVRFNSVGTIHAPLSSKRWKTGGLSYKQRL